MNKNRLPSLIHSKRGWIRIIEAFIAVMLIAGVVITLYVRNVYQPDQDEEIEKILRGILEELERTDILRTKILQASIESSGVGEDSVNELNVSQTLNFIKTAHGDQLYGKLPYWTHPRAVALTGRKVFGNKFNSNAVKTAFLHDVVEDTNVGLTELSKLDFDPEVIDAVRLLTKDKSLNYEQNIQNIIKSENSLAMMVKYADNYENFTGDKNDWDAKRVASSQKKYLMSLNMLGDKLGVKHHIGENFADGKNPQDKGDSKRHGINTKASVSSLRKTAKQGGRKGQLSHWLANMKAGRAKKNK